jgi:D-alanyl-D-alanine dipeptidase
MGQPLHRIAEFPSNYRIRGFDAKRPEDSYLDVPVDYDHPLHDEELVPLTEYGVANESYHARCDGGNPPYHQAVPGSRRVMFLRRSAAARLTVVNELLRPNHCEVFILDGYRSIECQRELWNFYYQQAVEVLGPASEVEYYARAHKYAFNPVSFDEKKSSTWPAHTTGGAVDLTLRDLSSGQLFDMGTRFEEVTDASVCDFFERQLDRGEISASDPRLVNRRLLHWAMNESGFVNCPIVFWHYDWGNQNYVKNWRALRSDPSLPAFYGYIQDPG